MRRFFSFVSLIAIGLTTLVAAQERPDRRTTGNTEVTPPVSFSQSMSTMFYEHYKEGGVQEKLYMVTDKPYYSAGDKIYFSAFLINSIFFEKSTPSSFIYVELVDANGSIVSRLKVRGEHGRFDNALPISTKQAAGRYTLRAYTRWQTNFDPKLLYSQQIEIGNYIDDSVQPRVTYDFSGGKTATAVVTVLNHMLEPIKNRDVEYTLHIGNKTTRHRVTTDEEGIFRVQFRLTDRATDCMRMYITANGRQLDKTIQLPSFVDDFSARFMPEGGNFIAGVSQMVAFRAVGTDGSAASVAGYVSDKSGRKVCDIASVHDGMGKFEICPARDEQYIATLVSKQGVTRTFELPKPVDSGCSIYMQVESSKSAILKVTTSKDLPIERFAAVVQARGLMMFTIEDLSHPVRLSLDKMRSGVGQVSIVDRTSRTVVAERLFFVRGKAASAKISPSAKRHSPREKMALDFEVRNSQGEVIAGDFAVSVTDAAVIKESKGDNIFSYLLLNSDLRGDVENPTYYFEGDDALRNARLDLVMMTHGWRRYDLGAMLAGKGQKTKYIAEQEQSITGNVTGVVGKVRNPSVMIYRDQEGRSEYLGVFPLNKTGRFTITGIDYPDTTAYTIQALNREGGSERVRIKVDPEVYPVTSIIPRRPFDKLNQSFIPESFLMRTKEDYYNSGGERIIDIEEVVVTARRIQKYSYSDELNDMNTISGDMSRFVSVYDALQRFRSLQIIGSTVTLRTSNNDSFFDEPAQIVTEDDEELGSAGAAAPEDKELPVPTVYINGTIADIESLDAYPMGEIISISFLEGMDAIAAGVDSKNGSIILNVRNLITPSNALPSSLAKVVMAGYCRPVEFYAPDYSKPQTTTTQDMRTTIAWQPRLRTDGQGHASMSFWTADRNSDYRVILEGITAEGELCREVIMLPAAK